MTLLNTLMETCATLTQKVANLEQDKVAQTLEILKLKRRVKKLEKQRRYKSSGLKRLRKVGTSQRVESSSETVISAKEDASKQGGTIEWLKGYMMKKLNKLLPEKARNKMISKEPKSYNNSMIKNKKILIGMLDEEPTKKTAAKETLLHESFRKLRAEVKVLGSHFTHDTPTDDPKEMSEENVKNMLQNVLVSEFKVEALQVKYPLIDWEIYFEGSRTYWKIVRVGGITQAYWSFEDMLKDFDREDLDALWRFIKDKLSSAVPTANKEKALWVELKRLFEPNTNDVIWKLQRYMHYPIIERLSFVKWSHDPDAELKATS
nr:hypothetical protein [Tanacetum cinerariifolium]